ncbi:MAG: L-asparaginase [Candidatus Dactylopiibacterium carminicum]|uniref:Asparaginase n=1 Tax=Candidatus Dactylopiibacterium carminicum TaxID=857335 RepID=A0A272EUF8_9RHOO|nr:asparaginase [Candidatus Dactylopiibacterium carminicum]KAF7599784.1 asparaginase [Candidatus Dactylopiibacterium carminicum]PAS93738.1 MAG: L-asparaginase [Candidatus Dactylopiibacterium carminicum]PAS98261.1 MAG: L-asparaginase [Candidatus Dactylopiibacterium carminicum]PAS99785.1 MAG: hypothetical protein BSR46_06230 [Candidatus Dactylopiibacterium carminicum]
MPHLALVATGGTIAGLGSDTRYTASQLGADALLAAQPALGALATWQLHQPYSLDSRDLTPEHWLRLASLLRTLLDDPAIDGIIVTHGTDTLEETALALDLLLPTGKPVVLTAAMRPANSPQADGPTNLLQAAQVACSTDTWGRGVLVVAHGRIIAGRHCRKCHTSALDALRPSVGAAPGHVDNGGPHFLEPASGECPAPIPAIPAHLPRVDILYGQTGMPGDLVTACVAGGTRGLVLALTGNGSVPHSLRPALREAQAAGVVVVRGSRIPNGGVWTDHNEDDAANGFIATGSYTPQQARVLLMLALAAGIPPAGMFHA